jgi:hypothetical protein
VITRILSDPFLFNWMLVVMQSAAALRHAAAGNWNQALYWTFANGVVVTITLRR